MWIAVVVAVLALAACSSHADEGLTRYLLTDRDVVGHVPDVLPAESDQRADLNREDPPVDGRGPVRAWLAAPATRGVKARTVAIVSSSAIRYASERLATKQAQVLLDRFSGDSGAARHPGAPPGTIAMRSQGLGESGRYIAIAVHGRIVALVSIDLETPPTPATDAVFDHLLEAMARTA